MASVKWRKRLLRDIRTYARLTTFLERSTPTWTLLEVPVIDGVATLPDGRTVQSSSRVVSVPVLGAS
jgi:hypothetical protein